ncbi:TRP47 family tandem repeat effector [Ehrlichia ruminantium]|uniref:TRP47 family tandem repeat effector n=1 Tax=Ehrlichia ruminantium TaxID=779 RepID=UPI002155314B|nr:TRP47 family tandem repeat effector [Ehrlichia ruminantium]
MVHSTAEDCMLHLTTRIDNINFGNDLSIYSNNQFSVSNGNITMEIGYHPHEHEEGHEEGHEDHHGEYHVMFTSNGHVLSDFHGVTGKHIALDVLNHSLQASFVVNLMEPFSEFLQQGSNFSLNLYPLSSILGDTDVQNSEVTEPNQGSSAVILGDTDVQNSEVTEPNQGSSAVILGDTAGVKPKSERGFTFGAPKGEGIFI